MSDLERGDLGGPANTAFREAYAEAERTAAAEAGLVDEQPRDEQGKFVAETPEEMAAELAVETIPAETTDDRDARIASLEARIAEKDAFIDRQGNEIGDLRQTVEERFASYDEQINKPQHRQITSDLIEQNPGAATQLAYEQNDGATLAVAFEQWKLEDPAAAGIWVGEQRANEREQKIRAEYDKKLSDFEARFTPIQASNDQAQLQASIQALPEDTKAFLSDQTTVNALAAEFPTIGKTIASGTPQERIEAVRALHDIHRGRTADTLTATRQDVARETAEAAQAARDDAYVASSTASQEQPKTVEQLEQERMTAIFAARSAADFGGGLVRPGK